MKRAFSCWVLLLCSLCLLPLRGIVSAEAKTDKAVPVMMEAETSLSTEAETENDAQPIAGESEVQPVTGDTEAQSVTTGSESVLGTESIPQIEAESGPVVQKSVGIVMLGSYRYLHPAYLDILDRYFVRCYSQYRYPTEFGESMQMRYAAVYRDWELRGPELEEADGREAGTEETGVQKMDSQDGDNQGTNTQEAEAQEVAPQDADAQEVNAKEADTLETGTQKADAQDSQPKKSDKVSRSASIEEDLPRLVAASGKDQLLFLRVSDMVWHQRRSLGWRWGGEDTWAAMVQVEATLVDKHEIIRQEKVMRSIDGKYTPDSALTEAYTYCIRTLQKKNFFPY